MVDKPISADSDDQDSWENLAKDLFGVEFDSPPLSSDDLDDELLNDDFLKDDEEPETSDDSAESPEPGPVLFSASEDDTEAETESEPDFDQPPAGDLDALLDFSRPYGEDEPDEETLDEEPEVRQQKKSDSASPLTLFEKLAPEDDDFDDFDLDESAESDTEEFEELEDAELVAEEDDDEELETDNFWDALEQFGPEELGTPHIDQGQTRGGKPPRDPEIGLVAGSPENELKGNSTFETAFASDADFGLGVLADVETDEDDDSDDSESAENSEGTDTADGGEDEKRPRRRRRRRRRGGRRKKPVAAAEDETLGDEEKTEDKTRDSIEFSTESADDLTEDDLTEDDLTEDDLTEDDLTEDDDTADDDMADDDDLSSEERDEDEDDVSRSAGSSRYTNIPTWSEAIDLIADRKAKSSAESGGRRGNRSDTKNRKRGGRRRPRKSSS